MKTKEVGTFQTKPETEIKDVPLNETVSFLFLRIISTSGQIKLIFLKCNACKIFIIPLVYQQMWISGCRKYILPSCPYVQHC